VKTLAMAPLIPHSEWFCGHLAEKLGIASPSVRIVVDGSQSHVGSRWMAGNIGGHWVGKMGVEIPIIRAAPQMSRIFAFDLFVHNLDRHTNNYIVIEQSTGFSFFAFDYSISWLAAGFPFDDALMDIGQPTRNNFSYFCGMYPGLFDVYEFNSLLNKIDATKAEDVEGIIDSHPSNWLTPDLKTAIMNFWAAGGHQSRTNAIRKSLSDGTLI
jgi:hypothetical protein